MARAPRPPGGAGHDRSRRGAQAGALTPRADRLVPLGALLALAALAWAWLGLAPMPMPAASGGLSSPTYAALTFVMWLVMMIGMMTPGVAPTVLLFDRIARRDPAAGRLRRTLPFAAGYFAAWLAFSALATLLQIGLIASHWIDEMGVLTQPLASAGLLAATGLYQWLPAKRSCLEHCRSPVEFLVAHYRPGSLGAARMGFHHGLYCLGCCAALMALLFVGGVMDLRWVAGITALVTAEKLFPRGDWLRRGIGAGALLAAALLAAAATAAAVRSAG